MLIPFFFHINVVRYRLLQKKLAVAADQGEVYRSNPGQTVVSYPVRKWLNSAAMLKQSPDYMRLGIVLYKCYRSIKVCLMAQYKLQAAIDYSDVNILANQETYRSDVGIYRRLDRGRPTVADPRSHKALAVENNQP